MSAQKDSLDIGHVPPTTFPPPLGKQLFEITASALVRDVFRWNARYFVGSIKLRLSSFDHKASACRARNI
jgi:hypothetical protein